MLARRQPGGGSLIYYFFVVPRPWMPGADDGRGCADFVVPSAGTPLRTAGRRWRHASRRGPADLDPVPDLTPDGAGSQLRPPAFVLCVAITADSRPRRGWPGGPADVAFAAACTGRQRCCARAGDGASRVTFVLGRRGHPAAGRGRRARAGSGHCAAGANRAAASPTCLVPRSRRYPSRLAVAVCRRRPCAGPLPLGRLDIGRLRPGLLGVPRRRTAALLVLLGPVMAHADYEPLAALLTPNRVSLVRTPTVVSAQPLAGPVPLFSPPTSGRLAADLRDIPRLPARHRGRHEGPDCDSGPSPFLRARRAGLAPAHP